MDEKAKCATCQFLEKDNGDNECRRYAPRPFTHIALSDMPNIIWPYVDPEAGWCGEYKMDSEIAKEITMQYLDKRARKLLGQ